MVAEFSKQKKNSGRRLWYGAGGFFAFLLFVVWGSGVFSAERTAPSFFADIKDAFSATFLHGETFRGEFDFLGEKNEKPSLMFSRGISGDKNSKFQAPISKNTEEDKEKITKNIGGVEIREPEIQNSMISNSEEMNVPIESASINIVEVCAGKKGNAGYEYIRLHNNEETAIDLSGWMIKKRSSTGNESTLVSSKRLKGRIIDLKSDFLLAREGGYSGNPPPNVWWPKSYTLAEKKNGIVIYDADGNKVAELWWKTSSDLYK